MVPKCKICQIETVPVFDPGSNLKYWHCPQCEFTFKDKSLKIPVHEEVKRYNHHNNSIKDNKYIHYFKDFIDTAILKYCRSGTGLDFGSGPSPVLATVLQRDYDFKMDVYDLFYSPLKIYHNQKYNLVTATEVIEHLSDPLTYFYLFKNLLKKNGLLAIMTMFYIPSRMSFTSWAYAKDACHQSFYSLKTMEYIANRVGLVSLYSDKKRYISFRNAV